MPAAGPARKIREGTRKPERRAGHRCYGGGCLVCVARGTDTLVHVETILCKVCGRAPECSLAGPSHVYGDRIRRHTTPLTICNGSPPSTVSPLLQGALTGRQLGTLLTHRQITGVHTGMMNPMHATLTSSDALDVETFAKPAQQRRFAAAMERIAAGRPEGAPVRIYVSAAPRTMSNPKWESWLAQITGELPAGVEVLHYRSVFTDSRLYDWDSLVGTIDGLVVVGNRKRPGSRVYRLGPVARLELRSLIAQKPVLLFAHSLGLIPVIDCQSQVLTPDSTPKLKLIAPKRWQRGTLTLTAALEALTPGRGEVRQEEHAVPPGHLAHPFAAPPH